MKRGRHAGVLVVVILLTTVLGAFPVINAAAQVTITVNGSGSGRSFQGVGALSAGASLRLLNDYPSAQQSQIYDYLFRCDSIFCGANLHRLKVEIGGDMNSTWGAEASIRRTGEAAPGVTTDTEQCRRGYEFSLLKAAVSRNSNIKLDALEWGAPGWIGTNSAPNSPNFWSQDNANYVNDFIDCAAQPQNQVNGSALPFSTVGLWNETAWSSSLGCGGDGVNYIKSYLYPTLQSRHPSTKIVAADSPSDCDPYGWGIASNINGDSTLSADIAYVGAHYQEGCGTDTACQSSLGTAQGLLATHGQYLWSSENTDDPTTAGGTAQILNRDYLVSKQTATILCCMIEAYFPSLYHETGLISTQTPWGNAGYTILPQLWAVAHTTQFTEPGWQYLDGAQVCLGATDCTFGGSATGSVVTLKCTSLAVGPSCTSGSNPDFSSIIETTRATTTQTLQFNLSNVHSLSCNCVHVWKSDLNAGTYFVRQSDIAVSGSSFTLNASPNSIYSVTTWENNQNKGSYAQNSPGAFPFPWSDNYQSSGGVVSQFTAGTIRSNFTGPVGMVYQTGSGPITVTELGRVFVSGNTQTHTVSVYLHSNHSLLGSCTVNTATGSADPEGFKYCALSPLLTLAANTQYDIVSQETNGGDQWYGDYAPGTQMNSVSVISGTIVGSAYYDGTSWNYPTGAGTSYGPVNLVTVGKLPRYLSDQHGAFEIRPCDGGYTGNCLEQMVNTPPISWFGEGTVVNGVTLGTIRSNFTGPVGMVYQAGAGGMTISQLGRIFVTGNTGTHTVSVYRDSDKALLGQCNVSTSSGTADSNGFKYCSLSPVIALAANTKYEIVSQETAGGDQWYGDYAPGTQMNSVSVISGTIVSSAYYDGTNWNFPTGAGTSYGPVNLIARSNARESTPETFLGRRGPTEAPTACPVIYSAQVCASPTSGGSLATGTYTMQYTYVTASGETEASPTNDPSGNPAANPIVLDSTHRQISVSAVPLPTYATAVRWYFASGPTTGFTVQNNGSAFTLNTAGNGTPPPTGDYTIESQVLWEEAGTASLLGRIQDGAQIFASESYYQFTMSNLGQWSLQVISGGAVAATLASGSATAPGIGTWHTMEMNMTGSTIKVFWDDTVNPIGTVTDTTYKEGGVGFGTGWNKVQFSVSCWNTTIGAC